MTIIEAGLEGGSTWSRDIDKGAAWASGMFVVRLSPTMGRNNSPESLSRIVYHEAGHIADFYSSRYLDWANSSGWYPEALAEAVADEAARLYRGGPLGVERTVDAYGLPGSSFMDNPNLEGQELSPWGDEGKDPWRRGRGNYSPGGAILLWAQKLYDVEEPWRFHQDAIDRALEKVGGERSQEIFGSSRRPSG